MRSASSAFCYLQEGEWPSWVNPVESAYAYNYGECVRVKLIEQ